MNYLEFKQQVYDTTLSLVDIQLIRLSAGNVSVRLPDGNVAITPSAILYRKMVPDDIVIVDINGNLIEGDKKPSSEKALHTDIYKARPDVNAVVHAHSVYSIAFSTVEWNFRSLYVLSYFQLEGQYRSWDIIALEPLRLVKLRQNSSHPVQG
jgi:L-ribulose-5-phosphate 4-epimerase